MIKREARVFLVVGVLTVIIDFCAYRLLLWSGALDVASAKMIGFLTGTAFAYIANRFWTFRNTQSGGSVPRFVLLYACTLSINACINSVVLHWAGTSQMSIVTAFMLATGSSAVLNFLGMKFFVFKPSAHPLQK